jgi:hypothetical protein
MSSPASPKIAVLETESTVSGHLCYGDSDHHHHHHHHHHPDAAPVGDLDGRKTLFSPASAARGGAGRRPR